MKLQVSSTERPAKAISLIKYLIKRGNQVGSLFRAVNGSKDTDMIPFQTCTKYPRPHKHNPREHHVWTQSATFLNPTLLKISSIQSFGSVLQNENKKTETFEFCMFSSRNRTLKQEKKEANFDCHLWPHPLYQEKCKNICPSSMCLVHIHPV